MLIETLPLLDRLQTSDQTLAGAHLKGRLATALQQRGWLAPIGYFSHIDVEVLDDVYEEVEVTIDEAAGSTVTRILIGRRWCSTNPWPRSHVTASSGSRSSITWRRCSASNLDSPVAVAAWSSIISGIWATSVSATATPSRRCSSGDGSRTRQPTRSPRPCPTRRSARVARVR